MGHPGFVRRVEGGEAGLGGAGGLHPTLRKGAKDGAPGLLWWGEGEEAWTWWCWRFTSHPSQKREGWGTRAFWVADEAGAWERA